MGEYGYRVGSNDYLLHYGTKGQKWGIRRFQNEDRTWTEAGKARYGNKSSDAGTRIKRAASRAGAAIKRTAVKAKTDFDAYTAKRKAENAVKKAEAEEKKAKEKAERDKRNATAAEYDRLIKMDPKYLTDDELKMLNTRKQNIETFEKNYRDNAKKGKEKVEKKENEFVRDLVKPALKSLGKAAIISMFSDNEFDEIAEKSLAKDFGISLEKKEKRKSKVSSAADRRADNKEYRDLSRMLKNNPDKLTDAEIEALIKREKRVEEAKKSK